MKISVNLKNETGKNSGKTVVGKTVKKAARKLVSNVKSSKNDDVSCGNVETVENVVDKSAVDLDLSPKTKVWDFFADKDMTAAAELLKAGELVAIPTETVYGLAANGLDADAIAKIYEAKGRPSDNPLILHVGEIEDVEAIAEVSELAKKVMLEFWPGPLTIVLPKKDCVPYVATGGLDTVAVRMPAHNAALEILQKCKLPLAAPSANLSGKPSPTSAKHVFHDFEGKIPMIVDGGECGVGLESTVLDLSSQVPAILRPGVIIAEDLVHLVEGLAEETHLDNGEIAKAPGMKYGHYAPKAEIILLPAKKLCQTYEEMTEEFPDKKIVVMASLFGLTGLGAVDDCFFMGGTLDEVGSNLFSALRWGDEIGADVVLAETYAEEGLGIAIMNRLKKAAYRD